MFRPTARRIQWILGATLIVCLLLEFVGRWFFGLGDPPLLVTDPEIEYLFRPSSTWHRFGHLVSYNQYSMRSRPFPRHKSSPDEFRVMVVGDSVINGGVLTDQSELATTLLEPRLEAALGRPVVVGNISAGSWGPPNQLAYLKRFGLFDADVVVFVVSSHDYADVPTFDRAGRHRNFPTRKPWTALGEILFRYVPRYVEAVWRDLRTAMGHPVPLPVYPEAAVRESLEAFDQCLALAQASGARVIVAQHLDRYEFKGTLMPGHARLAEVARARGVYLVQLGPAFVRAWEAGRDPYRDNIHLTAEGQRILADQLEAAILQVASPDQHRAGVHRAPALRTFPSGYEDRSEPARESGASPRSTASQ